jgi:hypothetical protein
MDKLTHPAYSETSIGVCPYPPLPYHKFHEHMECFMCGYFIPETTLSEISTLLCELQKLDEPSPD